jgi:hypothetical protein
LMGTDTCNTNWLPLPAEERLEPYSLQEVIHSFSKTQRVDI